LPEWHRPTLYSELENLDSSIDIFMPCLTIGNGLAYQICRGMVDIEPAERGAIANGLSRFDAVPHARHS
jgi:hypothetical protein